MKSALAIACVLGLVMTGSALADPMRCSGEKTKCVAACKLAGPAISSCVTNCNTRATICIRTGCWDNGTNRYCGLARQ